MADEGDALLDALRTQRNRALDTSAIMEARWATARSENAKLAGRIAELEAEVATLKTQAPTPENKSAAPRRRAK